MSLKIKIACLTPISYEWLHLHNDKIELTTQINEAQYIIYESNGDPEHVINNIKTNFPNNKLGKLVFILSGDKYTHIDNNCIWFTNAVKPSGLCSKQTQIFVSNPAIFKFYTQRNYISNYISNKIYETPEHRLYNIYFKGTIWDGMRTDMYKFFNDMPVCKIIQNNNYWAWRLHNTNTPTQQELENTSFETYNDMLNSKLCLCPKGNGNSSMRIIEAIVCGSIPVLINDFSCPFNTTWSEIALCFDTSINSWEYIDMCCKNLLNNNEQMIKMQQKGYEYFKNYIYCDSTLHGFKIYNDLNTVCFGFSKLIVNKLLETYNK